MKVHIMFTVFRVIIPTVLHLRCPSLLVRMVYAITIFDVSSSPCHPTSEIVVIVTTNESEIMSTVTQRVSGWLKESKP